MGRKNIARTVVASVCLIFLILDTKTAIEGTTEGIALCLNCIIPSLLPFCILSKLVCAGILGKKLPFSNALGMPKGTESILILGLIGGYPIGAQCIDDAYQTGAISETDAKRMLGFCNNAGPAFLFGVMSCLFSTKTPLISLYIIHILSAILVGLLLPSKSVNQCTLSGTGTLTLTKAVEQSVKTMISVCSWIIIFKIILSFIQRWFGLFLSPEMYAVVAGILELSNGSLALLGIDQLGLRFILASVFLAIGGGCIALQTISVTKHCGIGVYFIGKLLQGMISLFLSSIIQFCIFSQAEIFIFTQYITFISGFGILAATFLLYKKEKSYSICQINGVRYKKIVR